MSLIIPANSAAASGGYEVDNSVRLFSNTYLHKTPDNAGNTTKFTASFWVKRSKITARQEMVAKWSSGTNNATIRFSDDDTLDFVDYQSNAVVLGKITTRKFRDVGAWYHIVCSIDTTQSVAANRAKIFVNGVQETSFSTDTIYAEDDEISWNNTWSVNVGWSGNDGYMDGYMAEVVFIDGLQLAADQFGEFDEDSKIWKPIDVSGLTFGTHGFYLDFEASDNLGNDANGGTDFTESGLAAIDQSTDTCTNNFATLNPLDNFFAGSTLAEGNCKVTYLSGSGKYGYNTGTIALTSGKWYHEIKIVQSAGSNYNMFGIEEDVCQSVGHEYLSSSTGYVLNGNNGKIIARGTEVTYGNATAVNDIIGVYIDLDNNKLYFAENGTIMNSGTGQTIAAASATKHGYYFVLGGDYSSGTVGIHEFNFGNPIFTGTDKTDANGYGSFEYDPSVGTFDSASKDFLAICTKNLAEYG